MSDRTTLKAVEAGGVRAFVREECLLDAETDPVFLEVEGAEFTCSSDDGRLAISVKLPREVALRLGLLIPLNPQSVVDVDGWTA